MKDKKTDCLNVPPYGATFRRISATRTIWMERKLTGYQESITYDVTANYWAFARVKSVEQGEVFARSGDRFISLKEGMSVFLPPYSIVEWHIHSKAVLFESMISGTALPQPLKQLPALIFTPPTIQFPKNTDEVAKVLKTQLKYQRIDRNPHPAPLAVRAKKMIDSKFRAALTISTVAKSLRTSNAALARVFKASFGLTPVAYRNLLRVNESQSTLLFAETSVSSVAQAVGFEDFSRYYRNFKREKRVSPSRFRFVK
jgi:AraC-like DNA-binding protein